MSAKPITKSSSKLRGWEVSRQRDMAAAALLTDALKNGVIMSFSEAYAKVLDAEEGR